MHTLRYIIISLVVVVFTIIVLVRLYKRNVHLEEMAKFYRDRHCWEKEEGGYCRVNFKDDPFIDKRITRMAKYEREIRDIIKKFKKDPKLLEQTEKDYYEQRHRKAIELESQRKKLIAKRVFAYDYEDLLFRLYEPTAKEHLGEWRIIGIAKDEIIQRIGDIKSISRNEAGDLFKILVVHDLIWYFGGTYHLTPMLLSGNTGWDIVSSIDMNFEKWIAEQGKNKTNDNSKTKNSSSSLRHRWPAYPLAYPNTHQILKNT